MKKLFLLFLIFMSMPAFSQGYRAMTKDDERILVYSGTSVVYTKMSLPLKCKFVSSAQGIDNSGLPFTADGFSCTKSLFVVMKTWLDIPMRAIIEVDPKTEKSEAYKVTWYQEY